MRSVLFYYLCTKAEPLHRQAFPSGAQSKDADVFKWVTMFSASPAVCQRQHDGMHAWRPDDGGDEERVVRGFAVLQWDREGFESDQPKPSVGEKLVSHWGPALVIERTDDPTTGTYFLLKLFPHGYHGKHEEIGGKRTDVDAGRLQPA